MKIVSRLTNEEEQLQRLREIIEAATGGAIAPYGGELELGTTLHDLVTQVDITCFSLIEIADRNENENVRLAIDNLHLSNHIAQRDQSLSPLIEAIENGIEYDDAIDTATHDMMEAFIGSGGAESTFDGEISFNANVAFSKEDLKPMVREAVESWIRLKVR